MKPSADGPITYVVKEEFVVGSNEKDSKAFDVLYNASDLEVLCVCGLFNFRGYLCRHILCSKPEWHAGDPISLHSFLMEKRC